MVYLVVAMHLGKYVGIQVRQSRPRPWRNPVGTSCNNVTHIGGGQNHSGTVHTHHTTHSVHADNAAVNMNLWLTPDDANLDPDGGGLIIYRTRAPVRSERASERASAEFNERTQLPRRTVMLCI